jgi:5-amino-6-(5-phospho-D-ribitylamino)uracil phosphatase
MKKTLIVTDLDGTLLDKNERVSDYSIGVINKLIDDGIAISYATARGYSTAFSATSELKINIPTIIHNGAFIVKPENGEIINTITFDVLQKGVIEEIIHQTRVQPLVYSIIDGKERISWLKGSESKEIINYISKRDGDARLRKAENIEELYKGTSYYFSLIGEEYNIFQVYQKLKRLEFCNVFFQKELYNDEYWCEVMPLEASKGGAIRRLKKLMGFDYVIAFGDSVNDISMFLEADECYCVEDCLTDLKQYANAVIGSNENNAVAKWLEANEERILKK